MIKTKLLLYPNSYTIKFLIWLRAIGILASDIQGLRYVGRCCLNDYDQLLVKVTDASAIEPLGTKEKWWFDNHQKLFKANYKERGEDWAEVVVARLCELIGLPHASYTLAQASIKRSDNIWDYQRGVITESFYTRPGETLIDGDQLLLEQDPDYPTEERYKVSQYTTAAVAKAVAKLELPAERFCTDMPESVETALGVFTGYVMMDALVANQDRHHQNWGAVDNGEIRRLTPTFDHGASLAPAESVRQEGID